VIIAADPDRAEADLPAGKLCCPDCGGRLQGWSRARARTVRQLAGGDLVVRPRRVRCQGCGRTQVILPSSCLPRRADATEVIGAALHAKASGHGYRRIAADLGRSPSTVRRWLRAARGTHPQWLRQRGTAVVAALEPAILNRIEVSHDAAADRPLLEASTVLGAAVAAIRGRLPQLPHDAWTLIGAVTGGRLLLPEPAG
jgi:transposase-like protein